MESPDQSAEKTGLSRRLLTYNHYHGCCGDSCGGSQLFQPPVGSDMVIHVELR